MSVFPPARQYACGYCSATYPSMKELRSHGALAHAAPPAASYRIKKEEKVDDGGLSCASEYEVLCLRHQYAKVFLH